MRHGLACSLLSLLPLVASQAAGQQTPAGTADPPVLAPPTSLVAEGIPPLPSSLVDDVGRYTEARSAGFVDWHPVERELLIATRFGNTTQLHRVRQPGGARTQLTFFPEPVPGAIYEPREGRYFLFIKDRAGDEFRQIYRHDVADGRATLLTDGGRSQNGGIRWSRAGDHIAYASTRRNGADRDVWVMDPRDPKTDRLVAETDGGGWGVLDWSPDDRSLLLGEYLSVNESRLWLLDLASGERRRVDPEGEATAWRGGRFAGSGQLYVTTDRGGEFSYLARLDLGSGELTPLSQGIEWDVAGFELSDDGRWIAFEVNAGGLSELYLLDTTSGRQRRVEGLPVGVLGNFDFHPRRAELAFSITTSRTPADVYTLDVAAGRIERWTESETGGVALADLPDVRLVSWKSFDGRAITGLLYMPPPRFQGERPVIVDIHGGPEGQALPSFLNRSNYYLAELGIALLRPNVRGSTGYGKSFTKLDNAERREDSVKDIGALLDWIARQPELDASRVLVQGGSYGGYMSLAVATSYADRIVGAIDVVGISHFGTFLENTEDYRRDLRRAEYGDERDPKMREVFERISPLRNAARIRKPLFVVQGANDPRVPRTESEQMVRTVRAQGTPVWYLLGLDEGHGFSKKANADFQFYASVEFVKRHLLGHGE
jgi:dipeptidyl aminopeptidase/acylaminoacyl peptidase